MTLSSENQASTESEPVKDYAISKVKVGCRSHLSRHSTIHGQRHAVDKTCGWRSKEKGAVTLIEGPAR
jgi:hypothetical protein